MTRGILLAAAAVAAMSLAACQKSNETAEGAAASAGGQTPAVNAAQDAVGAAVGQVSAATAGANTLQGYVMNAAMGDMYEVQAAQIAQQKGKSADVKSLAKMIQTDHTAAMNEMKPMVTAAGQTPPAALDQRRQGMIDNLNAAPADQFDKVYLAQQVAAHEEALTLHRGYAENGDNAQLKAHAAKVTPKIQAHLERAQQLNQQAGGGQ
jgi:putative membrane protein